MGRKVRILIDDPTQLAVVHEFNREIAGLKYVDYPQAYCWIVECIAEWISSDVPWNGGLSDGVICDIESLLSEVFLETDSEYGPDNVAFIKECDRVRNSLTSFMETNAFFDLRDTLRDCMELYNYARIMVHEINFTMAKIVLELE